MTDVSAVAVDIALIVFFVCFAAFIVYLEWTRDRPLTPTDEYCSWADQRLDQIEDEKRAQRALYGSR